MSNSVSRSYPKNNQDTSLREETLCPCPPETSSCAVKCDLDEVDGGIFLSFDDCSICHSPTSSYVLTRNGGVCHYCSREYVGKGL